MIVTSDPQRFDGDAEARRPAATLVLPKPAWAWTILQAIRTRVERAAPAR